MSSSKKTRPEGGAAESHRTAHPRGTDNNNPERPRGEPKPPEDVRRDEEAERGKPDSD
ncbi:hypothetical protein [Caenispirillum salinarum]|uniref:hypothetical protein n=1 Tax=Caenispirillum salinarum TaxID=859058 RepID=UPI00384E1228